MEKISPAARAALALQLAGPGTDPRATLYGVDTSRGEDKTVFVSVRADGTVRVWRSLHRKGHAYGVPQWQFKNGKTAPITDATSLLPPFYIAWDRSQGCEVAYDAR